mgnify:CR=1 FL=1
MNLSLLILIPALTLAGIFLVKRKDARIVAFAGSLLQLGLSLFLLFFYMAERKAGNASSLLYESTHVWFSQWNINYHIGIDGISLAMILLTSVVLVAGVLVSWNIEYQPKEFFGIIRIRIHPPTAGNIVFSLSKFLKKISNQDIKGRLIILEKNDFRIR